MLVPDDPDALQRSRGSAGLSDASSAPSILSDLTAEQTERLSRILDQYLAGLDRDELLSPEKLLSENEDIRAPLELYFSKLGELHHFAVGFAPLTPEISDESEILQTTNDTETARAPTSSSDDQDEDQGGDQVTGRLGDFRLLRIVGRGGMGVVYEAEQVSLRRRVAIKLLPLVSVLDANQIARFKNEAQSAARLQHPNIVPVYAVGVVRGVHYYAMRFVDGASFGELLNVIRHQRLELKRSPADRGPSSTSGECRDEIARLARLVEDGRLVARWSEGASTNYRTVIQLGIEAALALAAAHEDGIVHRDIKPSNLMLDKAGKLWVTDFGLARQLNDKSVTVSGDILGTLRYMSPEQAAGQTALVDARSDIYSLGVTLYEILSLKPAIEGESSPALLRAIEGRNPVPLRQLRPDIPRDLITVIESAMSKAREERYATARMFAEDLQPVAEDRSPLAKPPTLLVRVAKWSIRNHRLVGVATIAGIITIVSLAAGFTTAYFSRLQVLSTEQKRLAAVRREHENRLDTLLNPAIGLKGLPGAERIREELLVKAAEYFRIYENGVAADLASRMDGARCKLFLAEIYQEPGDYEKADLAYERALAAYQTLRSGYPEHLELEIHAAVAQSRMGAYLASIDNARPAERHLKDAIDHLRNASRIAPNNPEPHLELGLALNELAQLLARTGDRSQALELLEEGVAELQDLVSRTDDAREARLALAKVNSNLASMVSYSDPLAAITLYQRSLELQQESDGSRDDLTARPDELALTYNNLGIAQRRANRLEDAKKSFQNAIAIQKKLVEIAPAIPLFKRNYALSLNNLGIALQSSGDKQGAEKSFREALDLGEKVIEALPKQGNVAGNIAEVSSDLAGTHNNLAMLLEAGNDAGEVDEHFQKAIELQKNAARIAPHVPRYHDALDTQLLNFAEWMRSSKRSEEALQITLSRRELAAGNANRLLSVAKELANFAGTKADSTIERAIARRYAGEAFETLRLVRNTGFRLQSKDLRNAPLVWLNSFGTLAEFERP